LAFYPLVKCLEINPRPLTNRRGLYKLKEIKSSVYAKNNLIFYIF